MLRPFQPRPSEYGPPKTDFAGAVPAENLGFNPEPARDFGNAVRAQTEKTMGPLPRGKPIPEPVAAPQSAPAPLAVPAQRIAGPPIYSENPRYAYQASSSKPIPYQWEAGGRGLSELEDDKGVQQDWADSHEKEARLVAAQAARDFAARNSMDIPKSELIRQARIAKPIPLGDNEDLTPILQQSLKKAKAGKAIPTKGTP